MQGLTQPTILLKPFADSGDKNSIPVTNSDVSNPQLADLTNGFPVITGKRPEDGGLPPERKDFNGLGYLTTTYDYFYQAGGTFTYNATIASAIGGYPQNARLWYTDANGNTTVLRSTKNDNTDNFVTTPSYIGTSWVPEIPALGWDNSWTGSNVFNHLYESDGSLVKGTTPSSNTYIGLYFCDKNGKNNAANQMGQLQFTYAADGAVSVKMNCIKPLANSTESASFGVGYESDGTTQYATASSGVRKSIVGWAMPNYSSATTYTKNSSASGNGYVFLCLRTTSDEDEYNITVNGKTIYTINPRHRSLIPTFIPVAKGDKVNWVNGSFTDQTTSVFVPCIGG